MVTLSNKTAVVSENRRAGYEYTIAERYEAGIVLQGWELKSIRARRLQINQSYAIMRAGEAWLVGMQITPLVTASTHLAVDPIRTRKLLLHRREIARLQGLITLQGYTLIPLSVYWKNGCVKVGIGVAKGKKLHDKRAAEQKRDWGLAKQRILKQKQYNIDA